MLCAKFGWKCLRSSGEKDFKKFSIIFFLLLLNYLPFEKGVTLHLNKLESPSSKNVLCQVWLKLDQWFWRRRFFKDFNVSLLFHNYLPFEKGIALFLNKLESPSPKNFLCQVWLKLAQWFWRRRWKCEKFTDGWIRTGEYWEGWWHQRVCEYSWGCTRFEKKILKAIQVHHSLPQNYLPLGMGVITFKVSSLLTLQMITY